MTSRTQVAVWFLLSSLLFSICLCYAPPLSSIHEVNTRGKQDEQVITREEENISRRKRGVDHDGRQTVEVFSPLTLYYHKRKNRDRDDLDLKRVHSSLSPHSHQPTLPTRGRKVGIKWNVNNNRTTSNVTTPPPTSTTTTTATAAATSMNYPFISSSFTYPPSPLLPSSSCSSPACKWLASWHFIVVVCMTLAWLVGLMTLYCTTRTTRGKVLLDAWSSLCTHDEQNQDEVTTKGIGYLDGSPGLRRFVLIEDEKEEEDEEDDMDDLSTSEFKDVESKEDKEVERGDGNPKKMKPPRRGTYILQEAAKNGVLEVGTYRIQEKEEEEEEEVDGKRKDKDKEEEEVEYILEGATYILQSERVGRGDTGVKGGGERGGYIGGIEGLYGIIGREGPQGEGYGGLGGLRVYGIMGRGEAEGIRGGGGRYGRIEGIEGLYEILHDKVSGGEGERREGGGDDGVLLSMRELVGAVRGGKEEKIRGESMSEGGRTGAKGEEWREVGGRGDADGGWGEGREGGREERGKVRGKGTSGSETGNGGKRVDEKEREGRGKGNVSDTLGGRKGKGVKANSTGAGEGSCRANTPPSPKRTASFPMDHFLSSHIVPRKLSLIVEEDIH